MTPHQWFREIVQKEKAPWTMMYDRGCGEWILLSDNVFYASGLAKEICNIRRTVLMRCVSYELWDMLGSDWPNGQWAEDDPKKMIMRYPDMSVEHCMRESAIAALEDRIISELKG